MSTLRRGGLIAITLAATVVGVALAARPPSTNTDSARSSSNAVSAAATPVDVPAATAPANPPPERLRVPAIGVDTGLETLTLDRSGTLQPPRSFDSAGWYAGGTIPGDAGPAVIAGHVDSRRGPAVFHRLHQLRQGDAIEVGQGGSWLTFRVIATERYAKDQIPTAAVYGPTPDAELRLITCGGEFDRSRRSYLDNVVVYAVEDNY
jgi:LPXTG-site transpeptidase (sortase) family protein